ncbi:MAG TPA: M48 family metallopeptidase [Vicinamibacterales bacterium]|nr:M48 family metallopeptidase [Vicinamibacterales bacterium]
MSRFRASTSLVATMAAALTVSAAAQTRVVAPKNKYSPADDVKLGQEAAQQVAQQLPIMRDSAVNGYLELIGRRLVENIPRGFQHPEFRYSFTGVNVSDINAFALPGGPMFINRGMIEKAHNEGEVAGVMAHELSHVALRHGTAQQTKATPYAVGEIAGQILGAIVGGRTGGLIAQGSQFGIGTYFMRFSREYERQADILGSHIMAGAGYDPRDMANVFKTIEQQGGPGGPQWLSDHPDPGNRYEYINQEAAALRVESNARRDTPEFQNVRAHLRSLPPAPTTEQATRNKNAGRTTGNTVPDSQPNPSAVPRPDSRFTTYNEGNLFRVSVPSNWREMGTNNSVTFAPDGAYGTVRGQSVFTNGIQIGLSRNETHDVQTATDELIQSLRQGNPRLSEPNGFERASIGGRQGLHTVLSNVSEVTGGQETIDVYTTALDDGSLFYALGVAPRDQYNGYANLFGRIVRSIQFAR